MNSVITTACSCCQTAKWFCPTCTEPGSWPLPTAEPAWPVLFEGACPQCRTRMRLEITGYSPQRPDVTALERALGLPAAPKRKRR